MQRNGALGTLLILLNKYDIDRQDFVSRLAKNAMDTKTVFYAWVLMSNHTHILLYSGHSGSPIFMKNHGWYFHILLIMAGYNTPSVQIFT